MTKTKSKKLFGGLAAVLSTLLSLLIGITMLAYQWEPQVNEALGIDSGNSIIGGDENVDTNYYKSAFGDITALYKSNPSEAETKALADAQTALVAAERAFCIREQEEGSVLLKNDKVDGKPALPLSGNENVTLFGNASGNPVYRSTSAGSKPESASQTIKYVQALKAAGFNINETLYSALENSGVSRKRGQSNGTSDIGEVPVSFYNSYKSTFASYNDAAIIMFARTAGEGFDMNTKDKDGISQLALHKDEQDLLKMVKESGFKKTIVLLNGGYPMETGFLFEEQYGVDACLWIGEPSMYGFEGVANVLKGKANPSGKLVDTYAANSLSSPAVQNFGNMSFSNNGSYSYIVEAEGIYVGYKYYETRYEDCILNKGNANSTKGSSTGSAWKYADEVVFPFGYGLSYTQFTQTLDSVEYNEQTDSYTVKVTVKNTGDVAGKCVVQVYAQTPYDAQSKIEKSAIQLVGYNKTLGTVQSTGEKETTELTSRESGTLAPNEEEVVEVEVEKYILASYSASARNGKGGYVLTAGDYYLAIGDSAHDALNNVLAEKGAEGMTDEHGTAVTGNADKVKKLGTWEYDETTYSKSRYTDATVENQLQKADINSWQNDAVKYLSRSDWDSTFPTTVSLTLSNDMKKEMDAGVYSASSSATKKNTYTQGKDSGIDLIDMKDVPFSGTYTDADGVERNADEQWEKFLNQLTIDNLCAVTTENTSNIVSSINAPRVSATDGPDGIGGTMQNGMQTTAYPSEVVAASAFNPKTISLRGYFQAEDGIFAKISCLVGPGANIHRTPFSGRNFEYYSEDSYLGYACAYYQTVALQSKGLIGMFKHYVGNNQETNRMKVATFNTEQAWRENSLRVFEGTIGKGEGLSVMSSYNLIGCTPATSNNATNIKIMVDEWGFKGINITDACSGQSYINSVDSIMNGTTMFCMDNRESDLKKAAGRSQYDDVLEALRQANKQYYYTILRSNAINGIAPGATVVVSTPWWKPAIIALNCVIGVGALACIALYVVFGYVKKEKEVKESAANE